MSQITRCPSCSTTFKVVADQLRISEGWVRCGQCKEVFDAAAHLLPVAAPALLPDVSLTDVRPAPAPVARKPETVRAWGSAAPTPEPPAPPPAAQEPVLDVPAPAVPAFLSAGAQEAPSQDGPPFVWRPRAEPAPAPAPTGYELPAAALDDLGDEEDVLEEVPSFEETRPAMFDLDEYPPLELPPKPAAPAPTADAPTEAPEVPATPLPSPPPAPQAPDALALVDDDSPTAALQASVRKMANKGPAHLEAPGGDGEPDAEDAAEEKAQEVSFVVAARRKAFWRKPAVRAALLLVLLLAVAALALQVAVHERDRIAALEPRARPWLAQLCAPLRCQLAPRRQIDDVVIDSSSFNKARGDGYQLALTVKSRAAIPIAMPAVELTLTDAQDQAVLRRVLQPADLGAPVELSPRGEWSTAVSVAVTAGSARVAGYRLLVFYP